MPEILTFHDVRPTSQAEQDRDEAFNAHQTLGLPYIRCKPREPDKTVLGLLRELFERLERPVIIEEGEKEPEKPKRRRIRPRKRQPQHRIQIDWSAIPENYRVSRDAIEALFHRVRPSSPGYGIEERRLAISEASLTERIATQWQGGWLLTAFTIRQPRKTKIIRPLSARYVNVSWLSHASLKPIPPLATNQEAKHFVDTADMTEYNMSPFQPTEFERAGKG